MKRLLLGLVGATALASSAALAAGFFTNGVPPAGGTQYPSTIPLTGAETIPADTNLSSGQNPASEAITTAQLGQFSVAGGSPRNYLLNGDMQVNQKASANITGGTTSIAFSAMAADRWFISTNVGSGAGHGQIITASPAPPAGFTNSMKVWRQSGALLQQVCAIQEIETNRATQLAGKSVVLSANVAALAGLSSTGNVVNGYIITGTGTDEGLGTLTASPAITPAWTGIAGGATPVLVMTTTTSFARFASTAVAIPATATEVGVEICFTPTATGSGTTDGFAMTGVQLEPVTAAAATNPGASAFEFQPFDYELRAAQRFWFRLNEPGSGSAVAGMCQATGANTNACSVPLPVVMRGSLPTIAITTAGTFNVNIAGTPTAFASATAGVCSINACTVTGANTNTAGQAEILTGGGGTGKWDVANDVVM